MLLAVVHSPVAQLAGPAECDAHRRTWLADRRGWSIEAYDAGNVYGQRQDADVLLRAAYRRARATYGRRTWIA